MYDNLPELIEHFPIGTKVRFKQKRDDYADGKFVVDGYIYSKEGMWYPAHQKWDNTWEVYTE